MRDEGTIFRPCQVRESPTMPSRSFLSLLLTFCACFGSFPALAGDPPLRVMTFNVRYPADDGENSWPHRRSILVQTVAKADPDVIGTQELFREQGDDLVSALPKYQWFGVDRRGGHADEHMGIFYRADRMAVLQQGEFWLSATPTVAGRATWGETLPRMVNWALFERKSDHRRFYLLDTHFAHREEDERAREKSAALIEAWIARLPAGIPVVLTGDFNTAPESRPHAILTRSLADAHEAAGQRSGPQGTYHDFTGNPGARIDWVLVRDLVPLRATTVTTSVGGRYPSDHFPVLAELAWPGDPVAIVGGEPVK